MYIRHWWSNQSRPCQFLSWRSGANLQTEWRWNQIYYRRSGDGIFIRARTGTTALITFVDPSRSLYVVNLGDCEARKHKNTFSESGCRANVSTSSWYKEFLGVWEVKTLSNKHNAHNEVEADRVRREYPNEEECIYENIGFNHCDTR